MIPRWARSLGEGIGNPLQDSCLENPTDRGAWGATGHAVVKSRTQLKQLTLSLLKTHPRLWHENCPPTGSLGSLPEPGVWIVPLNPGRERKRISPGEVVFGPGAAPSWGCSVSLRRGRTLLLEVSGPQPGRASLQMTGSMVGGGVKRPFPSPPAQSWGPRKGL